jgi:hypothetical protein
MRVLQVILMLSVFLGLNYYVFYRLWNMLPVGFLYRLVLILSAIVVISAPFLLFTLGDKLPYSVTSFFFLVYNISLSVVSILVIGFAPCVEGLSCRDYII